MGLSRRPKLSLISVFFTFFIDNLCWSIVFPIFAPYFLDPSNVLFTEDVPLETRTRILGLFLMAYSVGQFFGGPFLGEYADRSGKKKGLVFSVFFTLVGLVITAWSMKARLLWLLLVGRLMTGLCASNLSICLACIADFSPTDKARVRYFGYLSVLGGLSFVLGAFLGGKLSDPSVNPWLTPQFPLWVASFLTACNLLFVSFGFQETEEIHPEVRFDFWEAFRNIGQALQTEKIRYVYAIYFLFLFAWTLLFQFTPVLFVQRFSYSGSGIGNLAVYIGICWALGSSYLSKHLLQYFSSWAVLKWSLILFTLLCAVVAFPHHAMWIFIILGICVIIGGIAWPLCTGVISGMAPKRMQGKIMGISQSVQSLAMALAPGIGGFVAHRAVKWPFLLAAIAGAFATFLYFFFRRSSKK